jgi:voltage-gated potassium channel
VSDTAAEAHPLARLRAQVFAILHAPDPGNRLARWTNWFLAALIVLNAVAITLETVPGINHDFAHALHAFEAVSTAIFIVEYLARLWTCVEQRHLAHPLWGRLRYMKQPLALLDLVAIVTWWTPWDLRFLRVVRLVRLLRIFHLYEFEAALERLSDSLHRRRELLLVAVVLMAVFGVGVFALPTAIVIAAIIESSAGGTAYVCHECGHHGVTSHTHHEGT